MSKKVKKIWKSIWKEGEQESEKDLKKYLNYAPRHRKPTVKKMLIFQHLAVKIWTISSHQNPVVRWFLGP